MKRYRVRLTAVAKRHVEIIDAWWRQNRADAPSRFMDELARAVEQLATVPRSGGPYHGKIRRLLLRATQHHAYYWIDETRAEVRVRAVWHCARGRKPRL